MTWDDIEGMNRSELFKLVSEYDKYVDRYREENGVCHDGKYPVRVRKYTSQALPAMERDALKSLAIRYSNYVMNFHEVHGPCETGNWPCCIAEFLDNDFFREEEEALPGWT